MEEESIGYMDPLWQKLCGRNGSMTADEAEELGANLCLMPNAAPCCHPPIPDDFALAATILCSFVAVFGTLGNLLTVLALPYARARTTDPYSPLKSSAMVLVVSLAACDLLYCTVNLPAFALQYWHRGWHHGPHWCWVVAFLRHLLAFASFLSLAAIALNRCLAIWWPSGCDLLFSTMRGIPAIISVWLLALALCSPGLFKWYGEFGYNLHLGQCDMVPVSGRNGHTLMVSLAVLLPLCIMVMCSSLIAVRLRQISAPLQRFRDVGSNTRAHLERRNVRLTRLCFLLCGAFLLLVGPLALSKVCDLLQKWSWLQLVLNGLYWLHYAANFCIYALRCACFRRAYVLFLKKFLCLPLHKVLLYHRKRSSLPSSSISRTTTVSSISVTSFDFPL